MQRDGERWFFLFDFAPLRENNWHRIDVRATFFNNLRAKSQALARARLRRMKKFTKAQ